MHISRLAVRNFRNFTNAEFRFDRGVNTLVGENGSGKTNALYALRLLLDDGLSRRALQLRESDFNRAIGRWAGHWIVVAIDFAELDPSEGCQILKHEAGRFDGSDTGRVTLLFRPKRDVRGALFEIGRDDERADELEARLKAMTIDDYEPTVTGRGTVRFEDDAEFEAVAGDPRKSQFPDPDEEDALLLGSPVQGVHRELSCTFIKALRDAVADLRGQRNNPLLGLLRGAEKTVSIGDAQKLVRAVTELNADISALEEIGRIEDGIQTSLSNTVGGTYAPSVQVRSAIPADLEQLLTSLNVQLADAPGDDFHGELRHQGLGSANLLFICLRLLEFELKLASNRVAHILLLEEPEAHLHTHIQKALFERSPAQSTQVIVSTHSTHLSAASRAQAMNVLARRGGTSEVYQPTTGLAPDEIVRLERYLDATRSTLLFAKGVILVEGDAELILIPRMVREVLGVTLDELGVSLISMSTAFFTNVAIVFSETRVRRPCAIVTDLDASLIDLEDDPEDDNEAQKQARASQAVGAARRAALDTFTNGNDFVEAFYAASTFEAEFLRSGNWREAAATLPSTYSQRARIQAATARLKDTDERTAAREILRLATRAGKGWFALLLSEHVDVDTGLPGYIREALVFAALPSLTDAVLRTIARHRVMSPDRDYGISKEDAGALLRGPVDKLLAWFQREHEDDEFAQLATAVARRTPA